MASTMMRKSSARPTAQEYLEGVRASVIRLEQLKDKVQMLGARLDGVSGIDYSRDRVKASSAGDVMERRVMLYQDATRELEEHEAYCAALLDQAAGMLRKMQMEGCQAWICDSLEYYFLWGMSSREIAQMMHVSESHLRNLRREALAVSDEFVPLDAA